MRLCAATAGYDAHAAPVYRLPYIKLTRTKYISGTFNKYIHGIFGKEIFIFTVIYGVHTCEFGQPELYLCSMKIDWSWVKDGITFQDDPHKTSKLSSVLIFQGPSA
jgi:hypothetical protein